jgi:hypothetical protein
LWKGLSSEFGRIETEGLGQPEDSRGEPLYHVALELR